MARIYEKVYFRDRIVALGEATVSVASSAVLYGLSVYTVFPICVTPKGLAAFRLREHFERLQNSSRIIGIDTFERTWSFERFAEAMRELVQNNAPKEDSFARATVHVDALLPGTCSRGLSTVLSIFLSEAKPIIPQDGARLKTSVWRRVPDSAIPSRAKVNGAYVNSVLAKQDAIDSGYDDCIFLDTDGHVCELSVANIFIVRGNVLITPDPTSDLLEGINRRTVLEIAADVGIETNERVVDLTELYVADEVFACGTSAFIAPIKEIDARIIKDGQTGPLTRRIREIHARLLHGKESRYEHYLTFI